jgi:c-di-GMP-binding flagellar brake protein YcgR
LTKIEEVDPEYETGEQLDLSIPGGELEGTYSTVLNSVNGEHLEFETPQVNGLYLPVAEGTILLLKQYAEGATFEAKTRVLSRQDESDTPSFTVERPSTVKRIQRRDFVRVPCDIPIKVFILEGGDDGQSLPGSLEGTIEDISAGGVQLAVSERLPSLTKIELTFELPIVNETMNEIFADVIRVPDESDPPYSHGVKFTSITENKRNDIIQYVYERQMELQD